MSAVSRLQRGDNPEDVARLFNLNSDQLDAAMKEAGIKKPSTKKAAKKKAARKK